MHAANFFHPRHQRGSGGPVSSAALTRMQLGIPFAPYKAPCLSAGSKIVLRNRAWAEAAGSVNDWASNPVMPRCEE